MLTSKRSLAAATLSAGLLFTAAPAFASENASSEPVVDETISEDLIAASAALDGVSEDNADVILATSLTRASEPVVEEESNAVGDSGLSFSANVALTTEYRFRGVDLSGGEIAIQGGFDVSHSSGFYVGTWASSLDEQTVGYGSTELDIFGGWSGDLTDGLTADIGAIAYIYPDAGPGEFDYYEVYGSLGFSLGPASLTTGVAYAFSQDSLDFGGGQDDNLYLYTDLSFGIPETPITLNGHLGYTDGVLTFTNDGDAFDWSISADVAFAGNFTASIAYVEAEGDIPLGAYDFTDGAIVGTISASF